MAEGGLIGKEKNAVIELSSIPTRDLRAELARRELVACKAKPLQRYKWVCNCGNVVFSGGDLSTVFAEAGHVWCRICIPGCRRVLYDEEGKAASVPMEQMPA
jgi:hypothetical protein